jgi:sugar lactone lactonase YvrE
MLCLVLAGGRFTASAQVTFGGTVTTVTTLNQGTGFASFKSIAADSAGNIYATEMAYNFSPSFSYSSYVLKFTPQANGSYVQSTLVAGPSGSEYMGIAVDTGGNVYYADFGNSAIVELTPSGGSYTAATLPISITNPLSVAVDASGNLFLGSNAGTVYEEVLSQGAYTQQTIWTANPGSTPLTIALDSNDDLYITQGGNLNVVVLTNQGSYSYTQNGFTIPSGNQPSNVGDAVPDSAGDVYVDDSGNGILYEYLYANGSYTETVVSSSLTTPDALLLGANGNLFIGSASLVELQIGSVPFGTQAVAANPGTSTDTIALPFNVAAGQTVGSVKILTTGIAGKDFVDAGSSTCTPQTYPDATTCVVNVNFTPLAPGLRQGAVVIADGSGNTLSSVLLYGTGTGPLPVYASAASATLQGGYLYVQGAAVDSAGNVYVVDESGGPNYSGAVYKIAPGGAQTLVTSSISNPSGIAIDGAGNLYVSSAYPGGVYEIAPSGTVSQIPALSSYLYLQQIALDGQGNLYVAAGYPSSVLKYSPSGQVTQLGTGTQYPEGIAVDTAGNVYVGDCGSSSVYRITPSGATIGLVSGIYNCPASLAIDPAGNLYIGQQYGGPVLEYTTAGVLNTVIQGNFSLGGMALDSAGNLYYSDDNTGNLFESKQATAPLLAFAATDKGSSSASGTQVETLTNAGNAPLTFSSIAFPTDFPEDSADSTDCSVSAPLASSSSCTFTIDFKPVEPSPAALSETVTATTNYLPKPAQTIPVSGVELYMTTVATPTFSLPAGAYPAEQGVAITDATPNTTIFYTVDGSTPTTASALYRGPVPIYTFETLQAIAIKAGMNNSAVASAKYIIGSNAINNVNGGFSTSSYTLNGGATILSNGALQLTSGNGGPGNVSAWYNTPVNVQAFRSEFTFQQLNASGDGMTFAIQGNGTGALGGGGGDLGYGGIPNSVALKFDLYDNAGEGSNSTGVFTDGADPYLPATDLTPSGINLHSGDTMDAVVVYDGTNLTLTLTDTVTNAVFTGAFPVNIPSLVGGNTAYVGFTGGQGGATSVQNVLTWTFVNQSGPVTATPVFVPGSFSGNNPTTVTITDSMPGATFYYTVNGTTPTIVSPVYTGPLTIGNSITLKAIAVAPGYSPSGVASGTYTLTAANPVISLASGTYVGPQTVTLTTASNGVSLYYTTNGAPPNVNSTKYAGPITVSSSETLSVIAAGTGYTSSSVVTATYYISAPPSAPTFSPAAGNYNNAVPITLSDSGSNATFYYTLDGSTPTTSSTKYSGSIPMHSGQTINAIATIPGYSGVSPVGSATYTLTAATPMANVSGGTYTGPQSVTLTTATTGGYIAYTTNGTTPTASSSIYSGPITIGASETLKFVGLATGYTSSPVVTETFYIGQPPATPMLSISGGVYNNAQTVSISESAPGATIYYTLNGTAPTASSLKYTGPLTINNSVTLNAVAISPGYNPSTVVSATYTLTAATPVVSLPTGTYTGPQTVTITTASTNANLFYTTNNTLPTSSSTKYTGPITISSSETLRVMAVETGYSNSPVVATTYTIH